MIFVDSSASYARYTPRDRFHQVAIEFFQADETLTLFKARGNYERALVIGQPLLSGRLADVIWVQPDDVHAAWSIYQRYRDKEWSFTDCVSYVIMQRLQICEAIAFDEHFRQFGFVNVITE